MSTFVNGQNYKYHVNFALSKNPKISYVPVRMSAGPYSTFKPVIGVMDTGSSHTVLNYDTARILGISDPRIDCIKEKDVTSATGRRITAYIHYIHVLIDKEPFDFIARFGFAEEVKDNLFGLDWKDNFCLVFDSNHLHLLRD